MCDYAIIHRHLTPGLMPRLQGDPRNPDTYLKA